MATSENLGFRKIIEDSSCGLCRCDIELVLHILWECGVAQDVWASSKIGLQKRVRSQGNMLQLLEDLLDKLSGEELELFLVQCWIIWNQRNTVLHGGSLQDSHQLNR